MHVISDVPRMAALLFLLADIFAASLACVGKAFKVPHYKALTESKDNAVHLL